MPARHELPAVSKIPKMILQHRVSPSGTLPLCWLGMFV